MNRTVVLATIATAFLAPACSRPDDPARRVWFTDVTAESGVDFVNVCGSPGKEYILDSMGAGVALFDYDGDHDLDLYFVQGSTREHALAGTNPARNRLYRNETRDGSGLRFTDVTGAAGVGDAGWGHGCAVGDIDGDADLDLFVSNWGPDVLYRNDGDGTFTDVSAESLARDDRWGTSAAFADYDLDGDLDLYVANYLQFDWNRPPPRGVGWKGVPSYSGPQGLTPEADFLYQNDGHGRFTDVTAESGAGAVPPAFALAVLWLDVDLDGDPDLYVANDTTPNYLFSNDGGRFVETGVTAGVAYNSDGAAQAGMGVSCGDADGDGSSDLFVTNFAYDFNTLYLNRGDAAFEPAGAKSGLRVASFLVMGWGTAFADVDTDADDDLVVVNGHLYPGVDDSPSLREVSPYRQRRHLFLNDGAGGFAEVGAEAGPGFARPQCGRGLATGDLDGDGDVDLVVTNIDDHPAILRNDGPQRHWLLVRLEQSSRNRGAIGARVDVVVGGRTLRREVRGASSYLSHSDPRPHFGLGTHQLADVTVTWPDGTVERHVDVPADREIVFGREAP